MSEESGTSWEVSPFSRRDALKYALAAGSSLALADGLLKGAPAALGAVPIPKGKRADTIVYGVSGAESSINPLTTLGHSESYWAWDALTYVDPTKGGAIFPKLATSWKRLSAYTVEFKLRKGVKFSDGTPMTANDVKFSFDTTINEKLAVYSLISTVEKVTVVDPYTVRITTSVPDPLLERKTALQFIVPQAVYSKVGTNGFPQSPVGTGKYMVTKYVPGQSITLTANPHSWAGQPATPNVVWQMFSNTQAAVNALEAGQIDILELTGGASTLAQLGAFHRVSVPVGGPRNIKLDTTKPPFSDKNVRLAMNYAIDVKTLCQTVNRGFGTPLNGQLATPAAFGYNPKLKPFSYNPTKAKQLLSQAGYANGFSTQIASAAGYHDYMVGIAGYLAKVGVNATVVDEDGPTFIKEFYAGSQYPMYMYGANFSPLYDLELTYRWMTAPLPPSPGTREWVSAKWDSMLALERKTVNVKKRLKILQEMGAYLHDQVPVVFLDSQAYAWAWSTKVYNFNPNTGFFFLLDKAVKLA